MIYHSYITQYLAYISNVSLDFTFLLSSVSKPELRIFEVATGLYAPRQRRSFYVLAAIDFRTNLPGAFDIPLAIDQGQSR
jgi:hypothetical protein